MSNLTELKASGIFVDLENMARGSEQQGVHFDITRIMAHVGEISQPVLRKAYGEWGRFARYRTDFLDTAFDLVHLFTIAPGKNSLDIQMSVDAIEAIFLWPHISLVFLVTGDGDYCPLVRALRRHGRQVIGIGWLEHTSKTFQKQCDEFWPYDEIADFSTVGQRLVSLKTVIQPTSQTSGDIEPRKSREKDGMLSENFAMQQKRNGSAKSAQLPDTRHDFEAQFSETLSDQLEQLLGKRQESTNGMSKTSGADQVQKSDYSRFLARIKKLNMCFLGPELQDRILRAIHEVFIMEAFPLTRQEILGQAINGSLKPLVEASELSKTKINGVLQIIYSSRCFRVISGEENTPAKLELLSAFKTYDLLKRAHDVHLIRTALSSGINLPVAEWANLLLNDSSRTATIEELLEEAKN